MFFVWVAVELPISNSSLFLHSDFSIGWNWDCVKWYKILFKFTCRVRALGAFIRNLYLSCQQRPETKNLGDYMSATSCKTGTSSVFPLRLLAGGELAGWLWEGMWLWHCPQNHYEIVSIYKKMRHEHAILLVSVWKQTATYLFIWLTIRVIQSYLSQDLDKDFFTWECLSHHIQISRFRSIVFLSAHI